MRAATDQDRLVAALAIALGASEHGAPTRVIETHISYVLLTGAHAYKIKKAVEFAFLDFRTLESRRFFCERELELNRRYAPHLYLEVVPVTGSPDAPMLGGEGPAIEYAVKMREFSQDALASTLLERGELAAADIDALATKVALFHDSIDVAVPDGAHGTPAAILRLALQNLTEIGWLVTSESERANVAHLRSWTEREYRLRGDALARRLEHGFVRECHGDLHLGNIARVAGEVVMFDGIEFNDEIRWIDTMNEIAFTVMDLEDRGRADLAHRFLNAYLERTGDYAGLAVLTFYLVYRALVRAKVALLRAGQRESAAGASRKEARGYIALAMKYARARQAALIVTYGLSGSGKTTMTQSVLENIGAVRVRSDVERKRGHGSAPHEWAAADVNGGLYAPQQTAKTYDRLRRLARCIVETGRTAIVDATFLQRDQRNAFRALATELGVPFIILAFEAAETTLRARVAQRRLLGTDASDADLAVLDHQIRNREPLTGEEARSALVFATDPSLVAAATSAEWPRFIARLRRIVATTAPSTPLPC